MTFKSGDTIRATVTFKDWNGQAADPVSVAVTIYDGSSNKVVDKAPATRTGVGTYYYDYTPTKVDTYTIEFSGTLAGTTALQRATFEVAF